MKSDTHQRRSARMLPMQLTDAAPALAAFLSGLGEVEWTGTYDGSVPLVIDILFTFASATSANMDINVNVEIPGDCMGDALRGQKKDPSNLKACDCVGEDFLREAVADHKLFERQGRFPAAALMHCSLLQLPLMGSGQ